MELSRPVRHVQQESKATKISFVQQKSKNTRVANILEEIGFYKENGIKPDLEKRFSNPKVEKLLNGYAARITYGLSSEEDSNGGNKSSDCDFEEGF
jgi:hypothetical protein